LLTRGVRIQGVRKTTLSKAVIQALPHFKRLSIDACIYAAHGLYDVDFDKSSYGSYLDEARNTITSELKVMLQSLHQVANTKTDIIVDRGFVTRKIRDECKQVIEHYGGRWVLVFLDADEMVLRRRMSERRARVQQCGKSADDMLDAVDDVWESFLITFERPSDEGELVIKVS
jgi:predicted kinase